MATPRKVPERLVRFLYLLAQDVPLKTFNELVHLSTQKISMDGDLERFFTGVAFELEGKPLEPK